MVKIRLKRMGMRHRPTYRVVVMDSQRPRDGEYIESLGHYDPRTKQLVINVERARYWQSVGAQPTETVGKLIRRAAKAPAAETAGQVEVPIPAEAAAEVAVELVRQQEVNHQAPLSPPSIATEIPEPASTDDNEPAS